MKGMGGPEKFMAVAVNMKQMKDETEHRKFLQAQYAAQTEAMTEDTARKKRSDAAIASAFDPTARAKDQIRKGAQFGEINFEQPSTEESLRMALMAGADTRDLSEAASMFASTENGGTRMMDVGGVPVIVGPDGRPFKVDPRFEANASAENSFKPLDDETILKRLRAAEAAGNAADVKYWENVVKARNSRGSGIDWGAFGDGGAATPSPSVPEKAKPKSGTPVITNPQDYEALEPGAFFKGADGKTYQKPKA
jgi:hypothetical protein